MHSISFYTMEIDDQSRPADGTGHYGDCDSYGGNGAGVPEQKYRDVLKLLYAMKEMK